MRDFFYKNFTKLIFSTQDGKSNLDECTLFTVQVDLKCLMNKMWGMKDKRSVSLMYPYQYYTFNYNQYEPLNNDQADAYQFEDYYEDERQFGQFFPSPSGPPQGLPGTQGPFGPPHGPPGMHGPVGPAQGQGSQSGPPTAPPPSFVPAQTQQQVSTFAVDPGSIRGCLFRNTYVWQRNREQYWFFPIFVGCTSVSGWRWNGFRWVYFGVSLRQIESFTCF